MRGPLTDEGKHHTLQGVAGGKKDGVEDRKKQILKVIDDGKDLLL